MNFLYKTLSVLLITLLVNACGDSSSESEEKEVTYVDEKSSVNRLVDKKIATNAFDRNITAEYKEGNYFLAPLTKYSVLALKKKMTDSDVNDDGANYFVLKNIFETQFKTMKLNLTYNSEDSRDNFNSIFGLWRTSFTSYVNFNADYENANIKSRAYDTPQNACEDGFLDIKESLHRGLLKDASTFYDASTNLCIIKNDTQDVGAFNVWSKETGIAGDFHYLTKASGQTLIFSRDESGLYTADDDGLLVTLNPLEDGSYEYIDSDGVVNVYSADGKLLKIMNEGQETTLNYDDRYKVTSITGPKETELTFEYNSDETIASIAFDAKKALFTYDDKKHLSSIDIQTDQIDEEDTNETVEYTSEENATVEKFQNIMKSIDTFNLCRLEYNDANLLSKITTQKQSDSNSSTSIPAVTTEFIYDEQKRVIKIQTPDSYSNILYEATKVTKTKKDDEPLVHNISFMNSKQQITEVKTQSSILDADYNRQGQLVSIEQEDDATPEVNATIATQSSASRDKMTMNFTYNTRGLINKIQYASVKSGKKFVQLAYKSRYPKPTKVLTNDAVTFFDYNDKGQMIHKTSIEFTKEMKLRANSITKEEVQLQDSRVQKSFEYDKEGFLTNIKDEVNQKSTSYETMPNGATTKKQKIKTQWFWNFDWFAWFINWFYGPNIKVSNSNTQTVFVGGAQDGENDKEDEEKTSVISVSERFRFSKQYYTWDDLDTFMNYSTEKDPFKKTAEKLVVLAHSWGGDSAVEASKQTDTDKKVDLLITVDPVGVGDYTSNARHWIELYAMAGTPYGGYLHWVNFSYVVDYWAPVCEWKSEWWGGYWRCYTRHYQYRVYYPVLRWQNAIKWNKGDWVAFAGGKGWYSSYEPGVASPHKLYKIAAHHEDFEYMLWKMEKDYKSYGIIDGLRNADDVYEKTQDMQNKERDYSNSGPMKFGIGYW